MNSKTKELLYERFEVISRAADDCTYILTDSSLSDKEIENKLRTRLDRIYGECKSLENYLGLYFKPPSNSVSSVTSATDPRIRSYV